MKDLKTNNGIMTVISDVNIKLEKELRILKLLENLILKDKNNNDLKSLNYHTIALEQTKENIERLYRNFGN